MQTHACTPPQTRECKNSRCEMPNTRCESGLYESPIQHVDSFSHQAPCSLPDLFLTDTRLARRRFHVICGSGNRYKLDSFPSRGELSSPLLCRGHLITIWRGSTAASRFSVWLQWSMPRFISSHLPFHQIQGPPTQHCLMTVARNNKLNSST